jgi:hypothetical protein
LRTKSLRRSESQRSRNVVLEPTEASESSASRKMLLIMSINPDSSSNLGPSLNRLAATHKKFDTELTLILLGAQQREYGHKTKGSN